MAWRRKRAVDTNKSIKLPRLPNPFQISSYIKKIINASQYDFFETEPFEVTKVFVNDELDGFPNHGGVLGTFINNPNQEILGGVVLPLMPNISNIPVIGEHVVVVEYNEQHYYTSIINRKNSVNENSIPGVTSVYQENTKYGKTFKRKDIRPVKVNEGDIVFNGRFGQSIKLGGYTENNEPYIKIRCGQRPIRTIDEEGSNIPIGEDIERDGSSIYLLDNGLPFNADTDKEKFDGEQINGKKILIKSDGIFISGRSNLKFKSVNNIKVDAPNFNVSGDEVKLGSIEATELQPVVKGDELKEFLNSMLTDIDLYFTNAMATIVPTAPSGGATASPVFKAGIAQIKLKLQSNQMLSTKVKTK